MEVLIAISSVLAVIAATSAASLAQFLLRRRGKNNLHTAEILPPHTDIHPNDVYYNISGSGDIKIGDITASNNIFVEVKTISNAADLEYRVAILEGYIEWMLGNGLFVREIKQAEIEEIKQKATEIVRKRFPEAEFDVKEKN